MGCKVAGYHIGRWPGWSEVRLRLRGQGKGGQGQGGQGQSGQGQGARPRALVGADGSTMAPRDNRGALLECVEQPSTRWGATQEGWGPPKEAGARPRRPGPARGGRGYRAAAPRQRSGGATPEATAAPHFRLCRRAVSIPSVSGVTSMITISLVASAAAPESTAPCIRLQTELQTGTA